MRQYLCPILVGRDDELGALQRAVEETRHGRGGVVFLVGEAGIGKSRLARAAADVAAGSGMAVVAGRALQGAAPSPYRPLVEAALAVLRAGEPPALSVLGPYRAVLAQVVPDLRGGAVARREPAVVLAEAFLRLFAATAADRGCLVVLEDLHWSDPESLDVVDFLADQAAGQRVLCVVTVRSDDSSPALHRARALSARRAALLIEPPPLTEAQTVSMAAACLGLDTLPEKTSRSLLAVADGVPLLVEELLAAGEGEVGDLPVSLTETVSRRVEALGSETATVLTAAAVLGRRFAVGLLPEVSGLSEDAVLAGLRRAVNAQLVAADTRGFRFRHALTREAILAATLPPVLARLAARALEVVERGHPDLEGDWCELAADLSSRTGDADRCAELLRVAADRAAGQGGLASATALLERARGVAAGTETRAAVEESLVAVLTDAGEADAAVAVGGALVDRLATMAAPPARLGAVRLQLARACLTAGRPALAEAHLAAAGALLAGCSEDRLLAEQQALGARVAIDAGRPEDAVRSAELAIGTALRSGDAAVACEALQVLGRAARTHDLERAAEAFERSRDIAVAAALPLWEIRALHELGTIDLLAEADPATLERARGRALDCGALGAVAVVDLQLSACFDLRAEAGSALAAALRAEEAARRFRLDSVLGVALMLQACAHALGADRDRMEAAIQGALEVAPEDPDVVGGIWGAARAVASLLEENRARALVELRRGVDHWEASPTSAPAHTRGLWVLLGAVEGLDADEALTQARRSGIDVNRANRGYLSFAEAVALGRQDRGPGAVAAVARGDADLAPMGLWHQLGRRLVAEAALEDGWGSPDVWLSEGATYFEGAGYDRIASACRSLLRRSGYGVPPRPRKRGTVAEPLAALGVTQREAEVLGLVGEGLSNREIGERLYLSPRTVEKHVENLQRKTRVDSRGRLVAFAAATASR